jgi:hypothetical protein
MTRLEVSTLTLGVCLNDAFPAMHGLERGEFWKSNMACADYSYWLATGLDIGNFSMLIVRGPAAAAQRRPTHRTDLFPTGCRIAFGRPYGRHT